MTVILLDPRRPTLIPIDALELLDGEVAYTEELPVRVPWSLPGATPVSAAPAAAVLVTSDRDHPVVAARIAEGEKVIAAPDHFPGERLLDAVAMMDRLRSDGPWESEQTHESLRKYLLEETYELFDAMRGGDADELRDELGDVLLQVLFHARIAEDAPLHPFSIDDVADALVRKLGNRAPAVLAGESITLEEQLAQWEERKAQEKAAKAAQAIAGISVLDGLPTGQPALALAQKVISRCRQAGLPDELIPDTLRTITVSEDGDAENTLRTRVLEFMDDFRAAERALGSRGDEVAEADWLAAWPAG